MIYVEIMIYNLLYSPFNISEKLVIGLLSNRKILHKIHDICVWLNTFFLHILYLLKGQEQILLCIFDFKSHTK